jgi:hypothetical protein
MIVMIGDFKHQQTNLPINSTIYFLWWAAGPKFNKILQDQLFTVACSNKCINRKIPTVISSSMPPSSTVTLAMASFENNSPFVIAVPLRVVIPQHYDIVWESGAGEVIL